MRQCSWTVRFFLADDMDGPQVGVSANEIARMLMRNFYGDGRFPVAATLWDHAEYG